ncbi:MAG: 4Fe-4S dicluster domain-containing protein [Thermodesulfobacteriota bacterium]|nr:4Fe-4S dicluster domain-containing protein [Thermodesulfobacteriota bacterium]
MTSRVLVADLKKCTGCKQCELACSLKQTGVINPVKSCIHIIDWNHEGIFLPVFCQQCEDAPCMAVCPKDAIYRDIKLERMVINYDLCVACRMCVFTCPFGALGFDQEKAKVLKCDLCDGDPQCVKFCDTDALSYLDSSVFQYQTTSKTALMLKSATDRKFGHTSPPVGR